jgi:hypothetical protein
MWCQCPACGNCSWPASEETTGGAYLCGACFTAILHQEGNHALKVA